MSQKHRARSACNQYEKVRRALSSWRTGHLRKVVKDGVTAARVGLADETDEALQLLLTSHSNRSQTTTPFTPSLLHPVFHPHLTFL